MEPLLVAILGGAGGLLVTCLGLLGFTLWRLSRYQDPVDLASKVRGLETEVADLTDRVDTWMRREATRASRAAAEARRGAAAAPETAEPPARRKDVLRRLMVQRMRGNIGG